MGWRRPAELPERGKQATGRSNGVVYSKSVHPAKPCPKLTYNRVRFLPCSQVQKALIDMENMFELLDTLPSVQVGRHGTASSRGPRRYGGCRSCGKYQRGPARYANLGICTGGAHGPGVKLELHAPLVPGSGAAGLVSVR